MKTKRMTVPAILACILTSAFLSRAQLGSLDMTFNPGSGANAPVTCMALETNGQIVIGGDFTTFNGANQHYVAHLNADGSLDSSFYPGVGPSGDLASVAVQSSGEIFIAGQYTGINGLGWNSPALLRTDGSLDSSFNTSDANGGGVNGYGVLQIALQSDGKVLIAGNFQSVGIGNGSATNLNSIARLDTNGSVDVTFNPGNCPSGPKQAWLQHLESLQRRGNPRLCSPLPTRLPRHVSK